MQVTIDVEGQSVRVDTRSKITVNPTFAAGLLAFPADAPAPVLDQADANRGTIKTEGYQRFVCMGVGPNDPRGWLFRGSNCPCRGPGGGGGVQPLCGRRWLRSGQSDASAARPIPAVGWTGVLVVARFRSRRNRSYRRHHPLPLAWGRTSPAGNSSPIAQSTGAPSPLCPHAGVRHHPVNDLLEAVVIEQARGRLPSLLRDEETPFDRLRSSRGGLRPRRRPRFYFKNGVYHCGNAAGCRDHVKNIHFYVK